MLVKHVQNEFRRIDRNKNNAISREELYRYFGMIPDEGGPNQYEEISKGSLKDPKLLIARTGALQIDTFLLKLERHYREIKKGSEDTKKLDEDEDMIKLLVTGKKWTELKNSQITPFKLKIWYKNSMCKGRIPKKKTNEGGDAAGRPTKSSMFRKSNGSRPISRGDGKSETKWRRPSMMGVRGRPSILRLSDKVEYVKHREEKHDKRKLSMAELKKSYKSMTQNYKDDKGYLTIYELRGLLYLAGMEESLAQDVVEEFMNAIQEEDKHMKDEESTEVHFEDFCREFLKLQMAHTVAGLKQVFEEKKGVVKTSHMKQLLKEVHTVELSRYELEQMIDALDQDGDGEVSLSEYQEWADKVTKRYAKRKLTVRTQRSKNVFQRNQCMPRGEVFVFGRKGRFVATIDPSQSQILGETLWELWGVVALDHPHGNDYPTIVNADGEYGKVLTRRPAFVLFDIISRSKPRINSFDFETLKERCVLVPARYIIGVSSNYAGDPFRAAQDVLEWNTSKTSFGEVLIHNRFRKGGLSRCANIRELIDGMKLEDLEGPKQRAMAVYIWVTENLSYLEGKMHEYVNQVVNSKIGNALGFAHVIKSLFDRMGLVSVVIRGKAKFSYGETVTTHYWNAVLLMDHGMMRWGLIDASLAAMEKRKMRKGHVAQGCYFLPHPLHFALQHYPEKIVQKPSIDREVFHEPLISFYENKTSYLQSLSEPILYPQFIKMRFSPTYEFYESNMIAEFDYSQFRAKGRGKIDIYAPVRFGYKCDISRRDVVNKAEEKTLSLCWTFENEVTESYPEVKFTTIRFAIPHKGDYRVNVSIFSKNNPEHSRPVLGFSSEVFEGTAERVKSTNENWLFGFLQPCFIRAKEPYLLSQMITVNRPKHGLIPFGKSFQIDVETPKQITSVIALSNGNWERLACSSNKRMDKSGLKLFSDRIILNQTPDLQLIMQLPDSRYYKFAAFSPEVWEMKARISDKVVLDPYGHAFEAGFRVEEIRRLTTGAEVYISVDETSNVEVRAFHGWDLYAKIFNDFSIVKLAATGVRQNYMIAFNFNIKRKYMANFYYTSTKSFNQEPRFTMTYRFGPTVRKDSHRYK
ncbi:hypothetical protein AAMO2058_000098400 [Amorphochlora amoebiformis]